MQRCNFFRVGNRTCIVPFSHFRKLHLCTLVFLYLFFRRKISEIDRAVIPSEVVRLEPYPPPFLHLGTFPRTPPNDRTAFSICRSTWSVGGGATKKPSCSHTRDCVGCRAISASMVSSTIRASKYSGRR